MSLATRCTHCGTIFKVAHEQLTASEGWVRCGRCNEVFNAMPALFDLDTEAPPPRAEATQASAPTPRADSEWVPTTPPPDTQHTSAYRTQVPASTGKAQVPIPAATEFELDTAIDVAPLAMPQSADSDEADADMQLDIRATPSPWMGELPPMAAAPPRTDEADALDSRYLLPTAREHKGTRRRGRGPEFADAQFPNDAMQDAEDDWASDFGNLQIEPEFAPTSLPARTEQATAKPAPLTPTPAPRPQPPHGNADSGGMHQQGPISSQPLVSKADNDDEGDSIPTTVPSRFDEGFVPELPVEPPRLRKGRPGTRGRDPAQHTPEFLKRAQRQAFWRHPAMRAVLGITLLGLSLLLALQVAHQFRDLLAAYYPQARPALTQWCQMAGCQIRPPFKLDSLQVESVTLVRANSEGPDHYRLAVVIHNRSAIDVAWPHVDLTLTDDSGAVIARRVFDPRDAQWLDTAEPKVEAPSASARPAASAPLPAASPRQRSTTLQWRLSTPQLRPAGYTAELFYP